MLREGVEWGEFTLPMAGEHNALNATAAAALAAGQGVELDSDPGGTAHFCQRQAAA